MLDRVTRRLIQHAMTHGMAMYKGQPVIADHIEAHATDRSPEQRAADLTEAMRLEEKIAYIGGCDDLALRGVERLGIPAVYASDAGSGIRCFGEATSFPALLGMAASWNRELIKRVGEAIGEEARAKGVSILLGPGVNIVRIPVSGRNFEYMGEDPCLAGELAAAYIRGVQSRGVITTVKHFACNNSEYDRHRSSSQVDERTLHEIYLPAFRKAVVQGGSLGVMTAYNQINGIYASEHRELITGVLRGSWKFEGFVLSDWNSLYSTDRPIRNGLDLEMPKARWLTEKRVKRELETGRITEADIDAMVYRLLRSCIRIGAFDRPGIDAEAEVDSPGHRQIAAEAADEAMVLLKNRGGLLPADPSRIRKVALAGRNGINTATGGGGSSFMPPRGEFPDIFQSLRLAFPDADVEYIRTSRGAADSRDLQWAADADLVVLAVGFDHVTESEAYDRSWKLPDREDRLIRQFAEVNSNCVVILHGGGDMECGSWVDHIPALVHAFYLGQEAGDAVARLLTGGISPSGRLPVSMVREYDECAAAPWYVPNPQRMSILRILGPQGRPGWRGVRPLRYGEGIFVGYRHLDAQQIEPLFPFGFGLSYTSWVCTGRPVSAEKEGEFGVSAEVANTGDRSGAQVIQLYIGAKKPPVPRPPKELKGFEKIFLAPGERGRVRFTFSREDVKRYDADEHRWRFDPGLYTIMLGTNSRNIFYREDVEIPAPAAGNRTPEYV